MGTESVRITHPGRVIDPASGLTKLDLIRYYESVADRMLPHLEGRPCSLVRAPEGVGGPKFYQRHPDALRIPRMRVLDASLWPEHEPLLEIPTREALLGAAQMNVIEFHTWNSTTRAIDKPNRIVFDLDPGEEVPFEGLREAAALIRRLLQECGLQCWLKTSGGKGLHVVAPLSPRAGTDVVKDFARAAVRHLARSNPDRFVARSGESNRMGKIFVDYLRNGLGATTVAAYSVRARPGLGVSMPVPWDALGSLRGGAQWTIADARDHLSTHAEDPWRDYWTCRQTLTQARKTLSLA